MTGGASGIGEATCRLFAQKGAGGVVAADINDAGGKALEAELVRGGARAVFRRLDVTSAAERAERVGAALPRCQVPL